MNASLASAVLIARVCVVCLCVACLGITVATTLAEEPLAPPPADRDAEHAPIEFTRVHVPVGRLSDIQLGTSRYVPMSAREFEEGIARLSAGGPSGRRGTVEPALQPLADSARYRMARAEDGSLVGTVSFDVGGFAEASGGNRFPRCGVAREMPLGSLEVRSGSIRTGAGMGEAVVFGRRDGTLAMATPDAKGATPVSQWQQIMEITGFFAGESDDITYQQLRAWIQLSTKQAALGKDKIFSAEFRSTLRDNFAKLPPPRINSRVNATQQTAALPENPEFRLFGQRFTWDTHVMQQWVLGAPDAMPSLPTAAYIPAAFGDAFATARSLEHMKQYGDKILWINIHVHIEIKKEIGSEAISKNVLK
jgi:hypothetical protein